MKVVCFFIGCIKQSGGTERMTAIISSELAKKDCQVLVLSLYDGNECYFPIDSSVKLHSLYEEKTSLIKKYINVVLKIREFSKKNNVTTFIDVDSILSLFSVIALAKTGITHISWEHFNFNVSFGMKKRVFARYLAALFCDTIITLTEKDKQYWVRKTKCRAKVLAIENPIPLSLKKNDGIIYDTESKIVLSIGRFSYQKGFDLLIESWEFVAKYAPDWKLHLVGDGEDKDLIDILIRKKKLDGSVKIFPATKEIDKHYKSASIYCMTSRFEGLPMVLIEACYYGLPIVAFDCDTGPAEIVENGVNGLLCPPGNIESLVVSLLKLIKNVDDRINYSSQSCNISNRFDITNVMDKWVDVIV